jgi:hypothetical protein
MGKQKPYRTRKGRSSEDGTEYVHLICCEESHGNILAEVYEPATYSN